MITQLLEALVTAHGEEVVLDALHAVKDHLTQGKAILPPDFNTSITTAWKLTHGDRRSAYGTPTQVFSGYAKMWSGILAKKLTADLTPADVALMMTALKLAREANAPSADNVIDAHGYLIMLDEVKA